YPRLPEATPAQVELMSGDTLFYNPFDSLGFVPGVTIKALQPNHGKLFFVKQKESFAYVPNQGFVGNDTLKFDARYADNTSKRYVVPVQVNVRCFVEIRPDYLEISVFDSLLVFPVLNNDVICRSSIDRVEGYSNNRNLRITGDAGGNLIIRTQKPTDRIDTVYYNVIASGRVIGNSYLVLNRNECDNYFSPQNDVINLNSNAFVTIPYSYFIQNDVSCENYIDPSYFEINSGGIQTVVNYLNNSANREISFSVRSIGTNNFVCRVRSRNNHNFSKTSTLTINVR
ncbi:MAG: hypothetical protein EBS07_12935, partial [Sphingobacteriia bacterium]|nr:hypothetical protein [Sphingobacteriia bacterium]